MRTENIKQYLNELIEISLKNGQYYKGILADLNDEALTLQTYNSKYTIENSSISAIKLKGVKDD